MIVFIADIVFQALAKITYSRAAMVYRCMTWIISIYGFWTQSPTDIRRMVTWLFSKDRFTCPRNICELHSKFPSCLIIVLMIDLGEQVSICSDWNCGSYLPDILLWHMTKRKKDRSLIDKTNPIFIALTATAIHHRLLPWKTGEVRVPPEFGPGGGAQSKCNTRIINHIVNKACTDIFCCLEADFRSSSPEVQAKNIDNIHSMIRRRINSTGTDSVIAQPHNDQGSVDEDFFDHVPDVPIEQPDNSFNSLSSFVAATGAGRRLSAVLSMGGSAIARNSQPFPCSNSNSNSNDITNMTSVENMGVVDGCMIVEGVMSLGG